MNQLQKVFNYGEMPVRTIIKEYMSNNIPNYSNYFVTRDGRVFSTNYNKTGQTRELKISTNRYGYKNVELFDDNKTPRRLTVHRLVANAFIKKTKGKDFVNHKDGNKANNHYSNLEWVTASENIVHSYDIIKTQSYERLAMIGRCSANKMRKFSDSDVRNMRREHFELKKSYRELAKKYMCGKTVVERIVNSITYSDVV